MAPASPASPVVDPQTALRCLATHALSRRVIPRTAPLPSLQTHLSKTAPAEPRGGCPLERAALGCTLEPSRLAKSGSESARFEHERGGWRAAAAARARRASMASRNVLAARSPWACRLPCWAPPGLRRRSATRVRAGGGAEGGHPLNHPLQPAQGRNGHNQTT